MDGALEFNFTANTPSNGMIFKYKKLPLKQNLTHCVITAVGTVDSTASICPRGCQCTASDVLDCTSKNFTQPPIPMEDSKASDLLLEGNRIAQIDLVFLKHYPSLRLLGLAGNGLR